MLDFFFYNEISPKERLGPTGRKIENSMKKRTNAIIAIIVIMKNVEKKKANPTLAILQSLLEESEPKKKPLILEKGEPQNRMIDFKAYKLNPDYKDGNYNRNEYLIQNK